MLCWEQDGQLDFVSFVMTLLRDGVSSRNDCCSFSRRGDGLSDLILDIVINGLWE